MMKYTSLLFIFGLISLCFREIINMNSSIQNQFKICKKLKEEVPSLNLNCRELLRKQIEESNSIENISLNENLHLSKNKRTDISLLELSQENVPLNKIINTKKEKERDKEQPNEDIKSPKQQIGNDENNNFDFNPKNNGNSFNDINSKNKNSDEDISNDNESYDENLQNLHRIEKIENLINVINGNVNFINLELKSIKYSLMKRRRTNHIKQKPNRINQEDRINNTDKDEVITSEAVLREIEKLKTGHKINLNSKSKNSENDFDDNNESQNKKSNSNFKKAGQDKRALLQIKSFNDLNIDLDSLEKKKNAEIHNNNNNKDKDKDKDKENKQMQDLNAIIEGFKKKQASEESNLKKKKFHKQVTLNDKQEKLESNVNSVMELLKQIKVDNEDIFSQSKNISDEKADN